MMKMTLSEIDWTSILDPQDTNDAWLLFKSKFQEIIDKYVPTNTCISQRKEKPCILHLRYLI